MAKDVPVVGVSSSSGHLHLNLLAFQMAAASKCQHEAGAQQTTDKRQ